MATILQVENLARSYGEKNLFEKISFVISQSQKVALIARNGAGKTSLLDIIAGLEPCDAGNVALFTPDSFAYLKQDPAFNPEHTVFEEVYAHTTDEQQAILAYEMALATGNRNDIEAAITRMDALQGWEYENRIKQVLTQLKLPDMNQKLRELSGGQRKRVALAKVLITEPQFLILDEPTNHLDVEMIEWLEEYLGKARCTLLMVTHDRYFLDRVCEEILEMEQASVYRYKGSYSYFIEKQAERYNSQNKETERARNLLRTEQEWMRRMPKARTTKAKARIGSFYELKETASAKIHEERMSINIEAARMGKKILEIHDITFSWGDLAIVKNFNYTFRRNEKVGIIGNNGSGKSTFLELITGRLRPLKGHIQTGETVAFGYYEQQGLTFNDETRVIDVVREIADVVKLGNGDTVSAAAFLNYFMFPYHAHYQPVYKLSGGEKRRLYLVTVLMRSPNFLILDEPTNDLDILTLNVLEEYLCTFSGCIVVVTHDRFFLDKIVDHLLVFEGDGRIRDFPGNYTRYREWSDMQKRREQAQRRKETARPTVMKEKETDSRKLTYKEQREFEQLEREIQQLEAEKAATESLLNSGTLPQADLVAKSERFAGLLAEIEARTDRWLELSEKGAGNSES